MDNGSDELLVQFFGKHFPDFLQLIGKERFIEEYRGHSVGSLINISTYPFHYQDKCVIFGDALHAMVPFYGQGMNCGFEDVRIFMELYDALLATTTMKSVLEKFSETRKPQVDAICQLANENYWEMSSHVLSTTYKCKRLLMDYLSNYFPDTFRSQYRMVSFTDIPYDEVIVKRDRQVTIILSAVTSVVAMTLAAMTFAYFKRP